MNKISKYLNVSSKSLQYFLMFSINVVKHRIAYDELQKFSRYFKKKNVLSCVIML